MKWYFTASSLLLVATLVFVECGHTFHGTNVLRPQVYHYDAKYKSLFLQKRIEYLSFTLPAVPNRVRYIQGIMAYDKLNSEASANITEGGVGFNFVKLRMKSERNKAMHYDIYIYA